MGVALLNVLVNVMAVLREQGMLLASATGPIPNVAELVAGEPIRGSWWAHPQGHEIFAVLNGPGDSGHERSTGTRRSAIHRPLAVSRVLESVLG